MTREEARKAAEVMTAYADGKEIEFCFPECGKWYIPQNPSFDWSRHNYRIKSEPTYRPFKDKEECWNEMLKHQPFGWVSYGNLLVNIVTIDNTDIIYHYDSNFDSLDYTTSLKYMKFTDGTPFGIKGE